MPIILDALFMMRCSFFRESESRLPNQTVMEKVRMLSTMAVEGEQKMGPYPELLELTEMEKSLLGFFVDVVCVYFPFEVIADVGSKEFECVSDGDGFTFNEHRSFGGWLASWVDDEFRCF